MTKRYLVIVTLLVLMNHLTAHAQERDINKIFEQAKIELENGNFEESLSLFQEVDSIHPDVPSVVWNIGTLSLMMEKHQLAYQSWLKMRALEPNEWRVLGKLAQATKGLGDINAFNEYRNELVELHKAGTNADLVKEKRFAVEQIPINKGTLFVYQYFSPLSVDLSIFFKLCSLTMKTRRLLKLV